VQVSVFAKHVWENQEEAQLDMHAKANLKLDAAQAGPDDCIGSMRADALLQYKSVVHERSSFDRVLDKTNGTLTKSERLGQEVVVAAEVALDPFPVKADKSLPICKKLRGCSEADGDYDGAYEHEAKAVRSGCSADTCSDCHAQCCECDCRFGSLACIQDKAYNEVGGASRSPLCKRATFHVKFCLGTPRCTIRNEVEVIFFNGNTYRSVKRSRGNVKGSWKRGSSSPRSYYYPTRVPMCFDKVEVKATGSEPVWIDYMQIIEGGRHGKTIRTYGKPRGSGRCLSTDTTRRLFGVKCCKELFVDPDGPVRTC